MAEKPSLKLRLGSSSNFQNPTPPPLDTSSTTATPKLKLSFGGNKPPTPAASQSTTAAAPERSASKAPKKSKKDKPKRTPAPTAKKRALEASTLSDDENDPDLFLPSTSTPLQSTRPTSAAKTKAKISSNSPPAPKRLKLSTKIRKSGPGLLKVKTPITPHASELKKKTKIIRPPGVGYDSEASDRELDPAIEEDLILRMAGAAADQCDYLSRAIEERKIGLPIAQGGISFSIQFLHPQGRRALVKVGKQRYAATLVDLPCIVEGLKSWDRKTWYKGADICQILLVLGPVEGEEQCMEYPLPTDVNPKTWQYAHGLTPPMRNVRKRRFRKRASNTQIQEVEDIVDRLLAADEESVRRTKAEVLDNDRLYREGSTRSVSDGSLLGRGSDPDEGTEMGDVGDEDAEGSIDENMFTQDISAAGLEEGAEETAAPADDELEADLERAMMETSPGPEPPSSANQRGTSTTTATSTPAATPSLPNADDVSSSAAEPDGAISSSSSSSDEDASEVGDDDEDVDEDLLERQQFVQRQKEEIEDLEAAIKNEEAKLVNVSNAIFRKKGLEKIRSLREDLGMKREGIGQGAGEDDGEEEEG